MVVGAKNGTRTRDPDLGKVVLYQLSYFRVVFRIRKGVPSFCVCKVNPNFSYLQIFDKFLYAGHLLFCVSLSNISIFAPKSLAVFRSLSIAPV